MPDLARDEQSDEQSLVAAVRNGDKTAFEAIYRAYWPSMVRFARRIGGLSIEDAQELVQEVFLSLWRSRERWSVRDGLAQYLFGAVHNRARSPELRRHRVVSAPVADSAPTVDNSGPHRPVVRELEATIAAIIDEMPARCRDVYLLRHADGLDAHAIAAALGLSVITVNRHHARALHLLARGLAATEWADTLARVVDGSAYAHD
jgi:RNA polymerase sigma-70 factor, ECF subfamily